LSDIRYRSIAPSDIDIYRITLQWIARHGRYVIRASDRRGVSEGGKPLGDRSDYVGQLLDDTIERDAFCFRQPSQALFVVAQHLGN
jgi:hypothetical protein